MTSVDSLKTFEGTMLLKEDGLTTSCALPSFGQELTEGMLRGLLCLGALKAKVMSS